MVNAVILMNVERSRLNEIAETLADVEGISEVYSVAGKYDLVAIARVKENEDLAGLVTKELVDFKGITKTETLIAFRAISRHDLEAMFSVGF